MSKTRWEWVDIAKGIAIFLVVINHTGEGIFNAGIGVRFDAWKHFHDVCYTFMVPVFFLFSGWFSQLSSKSIKSRIAAISSNLIYPYLLWSFLQTLLMIVTKAGNKTPEWSDLPLVLLNGWMQFWFLHCLILIMSLDILLRVVRVSPNLRICGAFCAAALAVIPVDFPWELGAVAKHLIYFEVGVIVAMISGIVVVKPNFYIVFAVGFLLTALFYLGGAGYGSPLRILGAFAGITACIGLSLIVSKWGDIVANGLNVLGEFSLQLYVLHVIFAAGFRVFLSLVNIDSFWLHFLGGSIAGIVGPLVVAYLDKQYLKILFRFPTCKILTS